MRDLSVNGRRPGGRLRDSDRPRHRRPHARRRGQASLPALYRQRRTWCGSTGPPATTWRNKLCPLCTPSICATGSVRSSPRCPMGSGVRSGSACPRPAAMRRSLHFWALRRSGCPGCGIAASPLCGQRYAPTPLSGGGRGRISRPLTMIVSAAGAAPNADDCSGSRAWSRSPGACRAKRSSFPRIISRTPSGCI